MILKRKNLNKNLFYKVGFSYTKKKFLVIKSYFFRFNHYSCSIIWVMVKQKTSWSALTFSFSEYLEQTEQQKTITTASWIVFELWRESPNPTVCVVRKRIWPVYGLWFCSFWYRILWIKSVFFMIFKGQYVISFLHYHLIIIGKSNNGILLHIKAIDSTVTRLKVNQ